MGVIIEGKPEWFQCHSLQSQLFSRAAFLASQTGRAAFYIYVGTVNLYKLPQNWLWKLTYIGWAAACVPWASSCCSTDATARPRREKPCRRLHPQRMAARTECWA